MYTISAVSSIQSAPLHAVKVTALPGWRTLTEVGYNAQKALHIIPELLSVCFVLYKGSNSPMLVGANVFYNAQLEKMELFIVRLELLGDFHDSSCRRGVLELLHKYSEKKGGSISINEVPQGQNEFLTSVSSRS